MSLAHTTDGWVFEEALVHGAGQLEPTECKFLGGKVLYFFYGRPSYRPNFLIDNTAQEAFHSVCFLFDPRSISEIHKIFPFDTGAFVSERYCDHLHPGMKLEHFEMGSDLRSAQSLVDKFFGSNSEYFLGKVRSDFETVGAPQTAKAYHSLVSSKGVSLTDSRRSSVEIQIRERVDLKTARVMAVILPEAMLDDEETKSFIEEELSAEAIGYLCIHASPREDMALIMSAARDFYVRKGLI